MALYGKPFIYLEVGRSEYLLKVFVPFLKNLQWFTKKELDFEDWALILVLKSEGKHLIPEGKELILKIIFQMNSYRLSTNSLQAVDGRAKLISNSQAFLALPSNYKVREDGKILDLHSGNIVQNTKSKGVKLVYETGEIFKTFYSGNLCAQYLGIGRTSVYSKIKSNQPVYVDNKLYFIKQDKESSS